MNKPKINPLVFIGLIGILTIGTTFAMQIYSAIWGNRDIWWTPRTMQLPIEDSRDNFELFISGKPLQKHISDGTLFALDNDGEQYRIVSKDITIRLNNWNKVRSSIFANAVISGVAFGIVITMLVMGLIQVYRQKNRSANKSVGGDA